MSDEEAKAMCERLLKRASLAGGIMPALESELREAAEAINKMVEQNNKLKDVVGEMWPRASMTMHYESKEAWIARLSELGVRVS